MSETRAQESNSVAILGAGNLGRALADGWTARGTYKHGCVRLTRRRPEKLFEMAELGHPVTADNVEAVRQSDLVVIAVQPQQIDGLLDEISEVLDPRRHRLISLVSGVSIQRIDRKSVV